MLPNTLPGTVRVIRPTLYLNTTDPPISFLYFQWKVDTLDTTGLSLHPSNQYERINIVQMSSNISGDENDDDIVQQATKRINEYNYLPITDRDWSRKADLISTLNAFIKFLSQSGKISVAKDVVQARTDGLMIYTRFTNTLVTGVLFPSKYYPILFHSHQYNHYSNTDISYVYSEIPE